MFSYFQIVWLGIRRCLPESFVFLLASFVTMLYVTYIGALFYAVLCSVFWILVQYYGAQAWAAKYCQWVLSDGVWCLGVVAAIFTFRLCLFFYDKGKSAPTSNL